MKTQLNEPRVIHQTSKLFPNYFQITLLSSLRPAGWYHQLSRIYHGKQINISGDNKTKCIDNLDSYIVIHMKIQLYCKDSLFLLLMKKDWQYSLKIFCQMSKTNRPEKQWWPQLWAWQLTVGSNCFQNMEVPQKIIDLQNDLQNNDEDINLKELDEEIKKQKLHQVKSWELEQIIAKWHTFLWWPFNKIIIRSCSRLFTWLSQWSSSFLWL